MANTVVTVTPSKTVLSPGENFTVMVSVEPASGVNVAGTQFDLAFNPEAMKVNSVAQGTLFGSNESFFMQGTIEPTAGTLKNVALVILGAGQSVSTPGSIAVLSCTAVTGGKTSLLVLSNVIVANKDAVALPLESIVTTQIQVASVWDLNLDGSIDIADLMVVVAAFGMVGVPGWKREDLNADGVVNVLDMVAEAQKFD
jgi:hypothetical protein